jgi:hypothetical protein
LTTINQRRKAAAEKYKVASVREVSVNEKIACPACGGLMSFVATDEASKYYEAAMDETNPTFPSKDEPALGNPDQEPSPEDKPLPPPKPKPGETDPKGDELFQPVDEQELENKELDLSFPGEDVAPEGDIPKGESPEEKAEMGTLTPEPTETPEGMPPEGMPGEKPMPGPEGMPEEKPAEMGAPEEKPEGMPEEKPAEMPEELTPEPSAEGTPPGETPPPTPEPSAEGMPPAEEPSAEVTPPEALPEGPAPEEGMSEEMPAEKPKRKKRDVDYPKMDTPKFEKMPKEASDAFEAAVRRYSL